MYLFRGCKIEPPVSYSCPPIVMVANRPPTGCFVYTSIAAFKLGILLRKNAADVPLIPAPTIANRERIQECIK